ncbi:MAG: carboxylesterase/lipase family protein [Acidimicrobiales bacterium]|nr:carboxylesterase/lipase family protein [Acidimicrobiales bacterium]
MIVRTAHGPVEGFERDGVTHFRGLRYAAPPTGERRFRPPAPPEPWSAVADARTFGPSSWQNPGGLETTLGGAEIECDEDCLTLNVQTPACDDGGRPVLVWIHGGGFTSGTSATAWYDGTRFVQRGDVVVVSVNYRLGALGFLWLGSLGGDLRASGTNGILDQAAALAWVHDNIAAFGGDPGNVTIFGESAGAMSVATLLAVPDARGLFHRAIAQSGAAHNTFDPHRAEEITAAVLAELEVPLVEDVLDVAPERLVAVEAAVTRALFRQPGRIAGRTGISLAMPFQPVADGHWLPSEPLLAIEGGAASDIDLMVGSNADEWNLFRLMSPGGLDHPELLGRLDRLAGDGHRFHDVYAAAHPGASPDELWSAVLTDAAFRVPGVRLLEAHQRAAAPGVHGFEYLFTWPTPAFGGAVGSCHALEIPFVFDTLHRGVAQLFLGGPATPEVQGLAAAMQDAWIAFARHGRPASPALPAWPAFAADERRVMRLDVRPEVLVDPGRTELDCWDGLV